ncbi:3-hydroxyisobutyrate dehydrogenase [Streptomyces sp. DvalAA-14]|uniref:NAD(P)-dependent oxidoreductase n=1 Tax=unclassified Streptomyces TaxID=2593676 RepID=UPI00081B9DA8|nr:MULTISPECIES: NAD(P)-dependent oxidoreductase [unclassified Streptomyces]MYS22329.1 NAD-binding protein [Streptomyces sp. SID4948]SCE14094.1 3-hydroxyisobutyrate dehydrogenase [Streptomyces sp. DvalAA-14]
MPDTTTVAVLGAGALGAAMAARLGETGHEVRLWNRTEARARAAAENAAGVTAVRTAADAVSGAAVVITVLRDGDAVSAVMSDVLPRLNDGAVWVQASTVGPHSAAALAGMARDHGADYLDAPVSGSTTPARQGNLVWLVAGPEDVLARARPVLDDLGSSVLHVGTGVEGSAVKLAVNAWMAAATVAMSDVLGLCDALGIDHATFVRVLQAGPLAMPYELQKVDAMDHTSYAPGFAVQLALKDLDLAAMAAAPSPLLQAVRDRLDATAAAGHDQDDLAAVDHLRKPPPPGHPGRSSEAGP